MNIMNKTLLSLVSSAAFAVGAHAAPIAYEGGLVPNIAASGSVNGFSWFLDSATGADFWSFSGQAGQTVTFEVDRLSANLDPALSLYRGTTTADASAFSSSSSWGGMTYIGSLDDEHGPFVNGTSAPGGDPYGSFVLSATGAYTVAVGGGLSTDGGLYPYRLIMTVSAVPEPGTYALLVAGLGAIGVIGRRRRGAAEVRG